MVIINVPTEDHYDSVAKNSFFSGFIELFALFNDFNRYFEDTDGTDWAEERNEYYAKCQVELEKICVFASQACELALKSRICAVSPYLLLLGNEPRFKASQKDFDYTEFRTIDAVDLPSAVNALCPELLSDAFIQRYNQLRKLRNKITHLGIAGTPFDPDELLSIMIEQYAELWPEHRLLSDWCSYLSGTRFSFFYDGKYSSAGMELTESLRTFYAKLSKGQFNTLFGVPKSKRRYACLNCYDDESLARGIHSYEEFDVAHLIDKNTLQCFLCRECYTVTREKCCAPGCKGNVLSSESAFEGICHTCGSHRDDPGLGTYEIEFVGPGSDTPI